LSHVSESAATPKSRRSAVRSLIRSRRIATQEELRQLLDTRGYHVTQATLSRDLARLGARHVTLPDGGTVYELEDLRAPAPNDPVLTFPGLVREIEHNDTLVVLQTQPGAAAAVARAIDMARLPEALGTVAGDDTVFVAPARRVRAQQLVDRLSAFFPKR